MPEKIKIKIQEVGYREVEYDFPSFYKVEIPYIENPVYYALYSPTECLHIGNDWSVYKWRTESAIREIECKKSTSIDYDEFNKQLVKSMDLLFEFHVQANNSLTLQTK